MYVPEMYVSLCNVLFSDPMHYRPAGDYIWHWGRGLPEKTFEKWMQIVHS